MPRQRTAVTLPSGQWLVDQALCRLVDRRYRTQRWLRYVPPPLRIIEERTTGRVIATASDYARARALLARALAKAR
jgi:hypothetical protein